MGKRESGSRPWPRSRQKGWHSFLPLFVNDDDDDDGFDDDVDDDVENDDDDHGDDDDPVLVPVQIQIHVQLQIHVETTKTNGPTRLALIPSSICQCTMCIAMCIAHVKRESNWMQFAKQKCKNGNPPENPTNHISNGNQSVRYLYLSIFVNAHGNRESNLIYIPLICQCR